MDRYMIQVWRTGFAAAVAWAAVILFEPTSTAPRPAARGAPEAPGALQSNTCPRGAPGTLLWNVELERAGALGLPPSVAEDGRTVYVVGANGAVIALACSGLPRWRFDIASQITERPKDLKMAGAPVVGDTGKLFFALDATGHSSAPSRLFAVGPDGAELWSQPLRDTDHQSTQGIALAKDGRVVVAAISLEPVGVDTTMPMGLIATLDADGRPGADVRLHGSAPSSAPMTLADGRTVFASHGGFARGFVTPGPTWTPEPTEAVRTSTPKTSMTPAATRTSTPSVQPPSPTGPPDASRAAYLPWASTGESVATRATEVAASRWDTEGGDGFEEILPPQLHVLAPDLTSEETIDVGPDFAGTIVSAPGMVVMDLVSFSPDGSSVSHRLAAVSPDARAGGLLWQHGLGSALAGAPLIGRRDLRDGGWELIYLTKDGTLVSLQVPSDPASTAVPTFNWARELDGPAAGAPVLGDAGLVYAAAGNRVAAFRRSDGVDGWLVELAPDAVASSLMLAPGGLLYVGTQSGSFYAIATESGGLDPAAAWPALRHDSRNTGRAGR